MPVSTYSSQLGVPKGRIWEVILVTLGGHVEKVRIVFSLQRQLDFEGLGRRNFVNFGVFFRPSNISPLLGHERVKVVRNDGKGRPRARKWTLKWGQGGVFEELCRPRGLKGCTGVIQDAIWGGFGVVA